jgi:hypothetical protein
LRVARPTWRREASRHGLNKAEIDRMASAFDHEDLESDSPIDAASFAIEPDGCLQDLEGSGTPIGSTKL